MYKAREGMAEKQALSYTLCCPSTRLGSGGAAFSSAVVRRRPARRAPAPPGRLAAASSGVAGSAAPARPTHTWRKCFATSLGAGVHCLLHSNRAYLSTSIKSQQCRSCMGHTSPQKSSVGAGKAMAATQLERQHGRCAPLEARPSRHQPQPAASPAGAAHRPARAAHWRRPAAVCGRRAPTAPSRRCRRRQRRRAA